MSDSKPSIDLASATTIVIASMIGVGVYTTSGFTLLALKDSRMVVIAWTVGGLIAICGAIGYSALAARFKESGGEYLFLSKTVHPAAGIMAGWVSILAGFTGAIAAAAIGIELYISDMLKTAFGEALLPENVKVIAIASVAIAGTLHCIGLRFAARVQDAIVVIKIIMITAFIGFALLSLDQWTGGTTRTAEIAPTFDLLVFAKQLVWISFSYLGFNAAIYLSGEVTDSGKNVPRAMIIGTSVVTLLYIILNTIFVYAPSPTEVLLDENLPKVAAVAAQSIGGPYLANLVSVVIVVSLFTSVSAMTMTGPRVYAKMADDGVLPANFPFRTTNPSVTIIYQCLASIFVICFSSLGELLEYLGLTLSLCSAFTVGSLFLIKSNTSDQGISGAPGIAPKIAAILFVTATLTFAILFAIGEFTENEKPYSVVAACLTFLLGCFEYFKMKLRDR